MKNQSTTKTQLSENARTFMYAILEAMAAYDRKERSESIRRAKEWRRQQGGQR